METLKEYKIEELKEAGLKLYDVKFEVISGSQPSNVRAIYKSEKNIKLECSSCSQLRPVFNVIGVKMISPSQMLKNIGKGDDADKDAAPFTGIYHTTYHVMCEGCVVARAI